MLLSQQQFDIIEAVENGDPPTRYADMYAQIHACAQSPEIPQDTAASNVEAWLGVAAQTNLSQGGASETTGVKMSPNPAWRVDRVRQKGSRPMQGRLRCFRE
jgi:hypothetical protein